MPDARTVHHGTTRLLSSVLVLLGVAVVVSTLAHGGGPLSLGVILGVLLALAGAARLYLASRMGAR